MATLITKRVILDMDRCVECRSCGSACFYGHRSQPSLTTPRATACACGYLPAVQVARVRRLVSQRRDVPERNDGVAAVAAEVHRLRVVRARLPVRGDHRRDDPPRGAEVRPVRGARARGAEFRSASRPAPPARSASARSTKSRKRDCCSCPAARPDIIRSRALIVGHGLFLFSFIRRTLGAMQSLATSRPGFTPRHMFPLAGIPTLPSSCHRES